MPDITMCKGRGCPFAKKCHRYLTKPDKELQAYFVNEPYDEKMKTCDYKWDVEPKKPKRKSKKK